MVIDARSRYFVVLLGRLVCQLTMSFDTLLCMNQLYHNTMKKYEYFEGMEVFPLHPRKFATRTWFCNCSQYLCLFRIVVECIPNLHDPKKMLVLPNRLLCCHIGSIFCNLCHPHTQIRITLFHDEQKRHSQFGIFSQPCFNRIWTVMADFGQSDFGQRQCFSGMADFGPNRLWPASVF